MLQAQVAALTTAVAQAQSAATSAMMTPQRPVEKPVSTVAQRKLKLKEIVDQVCEDECDVLTEEEWLLAYARYEAIFGKDDEPEESQEPTLEQLSAVSFLLKTGLNPYVDFGFFGPH